MRITIIMLLLGLTALHASAQQYKPVAGSTVQFKVNNLGFAVNGWFTGAVGTIMFNPSAPATCSFDVSVDAASVNTDNSLRDSHLKDDGYFNVKAYPRIRLASGSITGNGKNFHFTGMLTIKGKTHQVSFPFTANAVGDGWLFKGTFKINRQDFDIGGTSTIANQVEINLNIGVAKA